MQQGTCERCGATFDRIQPRKRYCTERCQRQAEKQRYRARHTERARCKGCGLPFQRSAVDGPRRQVYCSLSCQRETRAREYRDRADTGRPRDLGTYLDQVRNDPCAYCGQTSVQLDHIEPRSLGGANHWENYTATCNECNSSKGNKSFLAFLGWRLAATDFDRWRILAGNGGADPTDSRASEARGATRA